VVEEVKVEAPVETVQKVATPTVKDIKSKSKRSKPTSEEAKPTTERTKKPYRRPRPKKNKSENKPSE